ncbi:hypothetical protein EAH87_13845 [Sphingomonas koreensis]|nr:hypothetical protein EAH87_13845 [Sphingomonas koreensis]
MNGLLPLALSALVSGGAMPAQSVPPIPLIITEQPPLPEEAFGFGTVAARMTVPVSIAGRGPYAFVVDTGAERTVVSHDLAGLLGLSNGRRVRVTAMTNAAMVDTVVVSSLHLGKTATAAIESPALDQGNLGAPGMLGIDALQNHAVSIDFDRQEMVVRPSRRRFREAPRANEIIVTAKSKFGQLIVTDAYYHGHRISVVIDTGTAITIANPAFLRMLGKPPKSLGTVSMVSALGRLLVADSIEVDHLQIGDVGFNHVPLAVADAEPFKRFDLTDQPALLLGMDTLRLFRHVQIDFANREIRFSLPSSPLMG